MLLPAYHIGILDFTLFENHPKFMAQYQILDVEDGYLYSDKLCIKVLDLTQLEKAKQEPETNKKLDRKSTRLNSSHKVQSRMPSSA